jgi:intracellular sulfur oxidation DsrE/DsrF family protein
MEAALARPARHRQLIAAQKINGGTALRLAKNALDAFQFALGEGSGALHTVCVFYGSSVFYVANDELWARYRLFDVLDRASDPLPTMVHTPSNPFLQSVETLSRRGVTWFVCDNTLHGIAEEVGAFVNADPARVYADFRRGFVAGTIVVPAGVAAIVLAQEAKFAFQPA